MEWTGVRYADNPTVEVDTFVDAPPEQVWRVVSDVELMPSLSSELQRVEWRGGATGPSVGASFVGYNKHASLGEWHVTSHITECAPPTVFAWAVHDPRDPAASWRFTLQAEGSGTRLRQRVQLGPGRSGLSFAIDQMPDKEQKIVFVRMREFEANMTTTLALVKERAEGARTTGH